MTKNNIPRLPILFPYYSSIIICNGSRVSVNGILSIFQALYGHKTQTDIGGGVAPSLPTGPRVTTPQPSAEDPALCSDPKFDTIFNSADGGTFIFKGEDCLFITLLIETRFLGVILIFYIIMYYISLLSSATKVLNQYENNTSGNTYNFQRMSVDVSQ